MRQEGDLSGERSGKKGAEEKDEAALKGDRGVGAKDEKLEVRSGELEGKVAELTNDLQRTRADFENYRKQIEVQKENERKTTKFATVYKFLTLLDDVDRAILSYEELKPLKKTLEKTLKELGLSKIETREGTEFNPDLHDAVMVEGEGEIEIIIETLRSGYFYEGEVLRPAMVKIAKK